MYCILFDTDQACFPITTEIKEHGDYRFTQKVNELHVQNTGYHCKRLHNLNGAKLSVRGGYFELKYKQSGTTGTIYEIEGFDRALKIEYASLDREPRDLYLSRAEHQDGQKLSTVCKILDSEYMGEIQYSIEYVMHFFLMRKAIDDCFILFTEQTEPPDHLVGLKYTCYDAIESQVRCLMKSGIYYIDLKIENILYDKNERGEYDFFLGDLGGIILPSPHELECTMFYPYVSDNEHKADLINHADLETKIMDFFIAQVWLYIFDPDTWINLLDIMRGLVFASPDIPINDLLETEHTYTAVRNKIEKSIDKFSRSQQLAEFLKKNLII